ncbi:MAG: hypothetical protein PWP46_1914 [Fusobacteriaceae bacterium]|jgi:uncharacterized protein (DUF1778 family)|nr:CopG family transcriptional regulator [Fusobacteriales bacterium]MDN5305028.1 hypothetical protein [Fusobacteriaceae bacterium]
MTRKEVILMISLRLNENDEKLIRDYAKLNNLKLSQLLRDAVIEKIENEIDLKLFEKSLNSMKKTYSFEEVEKELGL